MFLIHVLHVGCSYLVLGIQILGKSKTHRYLY